MRSKKVELWMPWEIYSAALADSKRRGYHNVARYFIGLAIKSMVESRRDEANAIIANENPRRQDYLFESLKLFMEDSKALVDAIEAAHPARRRRVKV